MYRLVLALLTVSSLATLASCLPDRGSKDQSGESGVNDSTGDTVAGDEDGDGFTPSDGDCDDSDPDVNPDAEELCDGLDNNCNDQIDEGTGDTDYYRDADGDGYGDRHDSTTACDRPAGYVTDDSDCDDTDDTVYPDARERCDGIDNDCNGQVDDGASEAWYTDADGDGYGDPASEVDACDSPGRGYVSVGGDCDDSEPLAWSGADEVCDGVDNDCDGQIDNNPVDGQEFPADLDGDGFGDPTNTVLGCAPTVDNSFDCDDSDASEPVVVDQTTTASSPDGTRTAPYREIQQGIDEADLCVAVYPGNYPENIDFNGKDIEVFGTGGHKNTIIDGGGNGSVVTFNSGETAAAELRGFTITAGTGTVESTSSSSACDSTGTCITNYTRFYGGGIYVDGAAPTLEGLQITGNSLAPYSYEEVSSTVSSYVYSYGGAIFVNNSRGVDMTDVNCSVNYADQGGGIYVGDTGTVTIAQSRIGYNSASNGGGFAVAGGTVLATNVVLTGNTASGEGGAAQVDDGTLTFWNVSAAGNAAATGAGVAVMGTSTFDFYSSVIAYSGIGYGVYLESSSATLAAAYADTYDNAGGEYTGVTNPTGSTGNVNVAPDFTDFTDNATEDDDFTLAAGSALINAGNPSSTYNDSDGTRNDIGAYGGSGSDW